MAKRQFSEKDMKTLKANPYTYRVTPNQIQFTAEFKEIFWEKYSSGKSPTLIVFELGYDPDILGKTRIEGILHHIRHEACSEGGFHTGYARRRKTATLEPSSSGLSDQAVIRLQNEVLYLRQELEFLKKIIKSDSDGKRRK
jgi:hypothetical protein